MEIPPFAVFPKLIAAILLDEVKTATKVLSETMVVKATRVGKIDRRARQFHLVVTGGAPNYRERKFIKACKAAGEPFPVRQIQLQFYPKKKTKKG